MPPLPPCQKVNPSELHAYVPAHYNPHTKRVRIPKGASLYVIAHEHAHAEQHRSQTLVWRAHKAFSRIPYLCRLARFFLEWEASRMALKTCAEWKQLTPAHCREARKSLLTYIRPLFIGG
jgi:hypothetical protein